MNNRENILIIENNKLRKEIPDIIIRSTFMVGFPSETGAEFKQLCKFFRVNFENLQNEENENKDAAS